MLILRLQNPDDQEFAYAGLGSNAISSEWTYGGWDKAVKLADGQPVILLVPTRDVLLTQTLLPTTNARQMRQALPFALEESLVGELEDQHFVWQTRPDSEELDVAVIERARLKEWMHTLRQHKLKAKAILPDVFALPWSDNIPTIWQRDGQVWVRNGAVSGFSCPADAAPLLISLAFAEDDQTRSAHVYTDTSTDWESGLHIIPDRTSNLLLQRSLQDAMGLNLLNGYQDESMSSFNRHWKRWRPAAIAAVLALGITVGVEGMQTSHLSSELHRVEQRNLDLFKEIFPGVSDISAQDVRSRVKSELRKLEGNGAVAGKSSPLPFMSKVAQIFQQQNTLKVTEIRTRSGKLTIVFEAPDLQVLDQLGQGLNTALGYEVDIKSTQANNVVRAELTLAYDQELSS